MILVIGGAGQGKLSYVLAQSGLTNSDVAYTPQEAAHKPIFAHLEDWVAQALAAGLDPYEALRPTLEANPHLILLCREVGSGVVPLDKTERIWREAVGRLSCRLASEADAVLRLFCGIPTVLKGVSPWK